MNIREYSQLDGDKKTEAFETAKKDWLRILFHDWYEGELDQHIEEYLNHPDTDIFADPDDALAIRLGRWCRLHKAT